jgi:lipid-binding SYLF domain-containing protein
MRLIRFVVTGIVMLTLAAGSAFAETDKAAKQAEVRKATQAALEKFYQAKPVLKEEVAKAPGYAVFTTYGLSFVIGGAGGKGMVHDAATKKDTFMAMAQASAGLQAGVAENETLIVFKNAKALAQFVDKGWEYSGGGSASAGVAGKSAGAGSAQNAPGDTLYYTLTRNGLQAGGAMAGTKFWKDKDLN